MIITDNEFVMRSDNRSTVPLQVMSEIASLMLLSESYLRPSCLHKATHWVQIKD
jgi:hypothetical protein